MRSNIILGAVIVAFSVYFYSLTSGLPERSALFPRAVLWCMGISGLAIMGGALWKGLRHRTSDDDRAIGQALLFQIVIPGALLTIAFLLLRTLGFYMASAFLVFVVFCYHTYRAGEVRLGWPIYARAVTFSVVMTGMSFVVFSVLLGLPTP
ncbi:tripartite tricarboxylate transporter TctB family protein [Natronospirillum operosum]|uniref:Tripartite tricarboxylate transporter TctB family protein n=1 Tax=Natronospirillum operosum TaxID=2759953 RepID=A0A4Z0WF85_9GAMM|nr:tripartite tricarboxylate transporter TctB family protein [Natronospirillum operosum]TGG93198.1 tripartite tricarboxylate transporter TctB family protein [Natronospirillum operosum]